MIELLNNRASTQAKGQRYDTMLEQIQVRKAEIQSRLLTSQSEAGSVQENLQSYEQELKEISDKIIELTESNQANEDEIAEIQKEMQGKSEELRNRQTSYHRDRSRLESLRNITERYDGYGNSIRKVMECRNREPGLLGVVADIVKVEKAYEAAIETALGGSIQNIVTDNEDTAKRMIGFLKKNKYGRATFLPLTSVSARSGLNRPEVLKETGVIGLADTLVKVDPKYRELAASLLGRTVVVDNIDRGIAIARKYKQSLRLVTLEGDLLNPGGSMTGGAFRNSSNLLSRRREIEDLEKRVAHWKESMELLELETEALRARRTACYTAMDEVQKELQEAYVVQNTAKMNVDQASNRISAALQAAKQAKDETAELNQQIADIGDNQGAIAQELKDSEQMEQEINRKASEGQKALEELRKQESSKQKETESLHIATAGLEQQLAFIRENTARIEI